MKTSAIGIAIVVAFGLSACGKHDADRLRDKYGAPVNRETFIVRPGIEMVVDYGPAKQICRIQLPSGYWIGGKS